MPGHPKAVKQLVHWTWPFEVITKFEVGVDEDEGSSIILVWHDASRDRCRRLLTSWHLACHASHDRETRGSSSLDVKAVSTFIYVHTSRASPPFRHEHSVDRVGHEFHPFDSTTMVTQSLAAWVVGDHLVVINRLQLGLSCRHGEISIGVSTIGVASPRRLFLFSYYQSWDHLIQARCLLSARDEKRVDPLCLLLWFAARN